MPSAAVSAILSKFDKVKASGGQWLVVCPGHPDKSPSLAVKEGSDGSVLLKCHAGCDTDRILAAMGLSAAALFEPKDEQKRTIQSEYPYEDEQGTLLYQALRFTPKGFSQRRPDGNGWVYNLQGVRRVVYRLPELLGQKAILFCEGEKDVDRAWKIGIPATCNPMGAGKWDPSYAVQLKGQGIERVAILPDNDQPGAAHAAAVAAGLKVAGLDVRIVPLPGLKDHGDLSDWLDAGGSKDALLALVKAAYSGPQADIAPPPPPAAKRFYEAGDQRYQMDLPEGITLDVTRLKRSSEGLSGELTVRVNGQFPNAKTFNEGLLSIGDLNFSSVVARGTRAKLLGERSGDKAFDWHGAVEEFVISVIAAERKGKPAEVLADAVDEDDDGSDAWVIDGYPVLQQLPQIIFGDASSGKSMFAMWLAGKLAEMGVNVLYADWEFSKSEHQKRLKKLFRPMPKNLLYIRCDHSLKQETDHLIDVIQKNKIHYIICDSIGFAVDGPAESQEGAAGYFRYLRQLRVGSLNIAHMPKQSDDTREATVFGSVFWKAGARSIWFIDRAKENPAGEIRFGLYHRKSNVGELLKPKGFKLTFRGEITTCEAINLKDVEELAAGFPLLDRMKELLVSSPLTMKQIADELNTSLPNVKSVLSRHRSQFVKVGTRYSVSSGRLDDNAENVVDF